MQSDTVNANSILQLREQETLQLPMAYHSFALDCVWLTSNMARECTASGWFGAGQNLRFVSMLYADLAFAARSS